MNPELTREGSADEQEYHLWEASRSYMRGEMDIKDLEKIEHLHDLDLKDAVMALAKRKVKRHFVRVLPGRIRVLRW
ncbi:MAG TPA: hypothetical protein VEL49_04080 [Ktedonobacteraceae bacterium]|nr:hypothetical protein [Ktedonobacteraceae bacterium]